MMQQVEALFKSEVIILLSIFQSYILINTTMSNAPPLGGGMRLLVGSKFETVDLVKECVKDFNKEHCVDFVVNTNNQKSLRFICKHGCPQRKRSKGERVQQHYNALNCEAFINFYKTKKDGIKCTQINNIHNHPVSKEIYNREHVELNEEEVALCATLKSGNCKPSQIRKVMVEKFNKKLTIQKLKNILRKAIPEDTEDLDSSEFFEDFQNEGGEVSWELDPDETVRCLAFSSLKMKNAFRTSDPPLVQLDTTFEIEAARYKVMAVVYLNPTTNKSELAFAAIICDETQANIEFALKAFKRICVRDNLIFTVDKDFGQLAVLRTVFPEAVVLLCIFHVIKFMKVLFASAPIVVDRKHELLESFKKILYSSSSEVFEATETEFLELCKGVTVKTGDKQTSLSRYYERNWRSCKEMWVRAYRKHLPHLGDNTSNRVERYFWSIKKSIKDLFLSLPPTVVAAVHLIKFADSRLEEKYAFAVNKSTVIYDKNEYIAALNTEASMVLNDRGCTLFHIALKKLEKKMNKFQKVDDGVKEVFEKGNCVYQTTENSCNCSFSNNHQSPCAHILFLRSMDEFPDGIFSKDLFHRRYHRVFDLLDSLLDDPNGNVVQDQDEGFDKVEDSGEDNEDAEEETVLDDRQKYKLVTPIVMRIGNLIACHPTKKFLQYLDALNELEKRIRRGQNFTLQMHHILADINDNTDDEGLENIDNNGETGDFVTEDDAAVEMDDSQATVVQEDDSDRPGPSTSRNRFNLVFKKSLKTKGRPKKKSKQFSFNKTAADRKKKNTIAKGKGSSKKDYIEDSDISSEDSSDIDSKLDDDSDDDLVEEELPVSSVDMEISFKCAICGKVIEGQPSSCERCNSLYHKDCDHSYCA